MGDLRSGNRPSAGWVGMRSFRLLPPHEPCKDQKQDADQSHEGACYNFWLQGSRIDPDVDIIPKMHAHSDHDQQNTEQSNYECLGSFLQWPGFSKGLIMPLCHVSELQFLKTSVSIHADAKGLCDRSARAKTLAHERASFLAGLKTFLSDLGDDLARIV